MKIIHTKTSRKNFQNLPLTIQQIVEKQLKLFLSNPRHPSLGIKKIQGSKNIWEGRITKDIRFTFQIDRDTYILRRIGRHNEVLRKP